MPAVLVIVATAIGGAGAAVAGVIVALGLVTHTGLESGVWGVYQTDDLGIIWLIAAIALAFAGAIYQARTVATLSAAISEEQYMNPGVNRGGPSGHRCCLIEADGSGWTRLTTGTAGARAPAVSDPRPAHRAPAATITPMEPEIRPVRRITVARAADLEEGTMLMVQVDGTNILLVNQDGLHALQGTCSHEYFELDQGFLSDGSVTCALHLSRFDLTDGEPLDPPADLPLATYAVRLGRRGHRARAAGGRHPHQRVARSAQDGADAALPRRSAGRRRRRRRRPGPRQGA